MNVLINNESEKYIMSVSDCCEEFGIGQTELKRLIETGETLNGYCFDWIEEEE